MYMTERFGSWQVGDNPERGRVEFALFFPDRAHDPAQYAPTRFDAAGQPIPHFGDPQIAAVRVVGDFQEQLGQVNWDPVHAPALVRERHAKGWRWRHRTTVELPAGFYQYKYHVTFTDGTTRLVGDPCTRYGGSTAQNAAFVVGGSHSTVPPLAGTRKHLRDLIVYELMIDDFTDEYRGARAPLDAVRDRLGYLQDDLGINAILFMPWTAWPGEGFSWGYTPHQYFSVEYRYANAPGAPAEKLSWLKALIRACHERGIQVIMDGVFNHVGDADPDGGDAIGFPYRWLYRDPAACPYVGTFGGEFSGLRDLDYHNGCTQEFIGAVCQYWIDTFQIDGIRFDNTVNFYVPGEDGGLPRLLREIRAHVTARGQGTFATILEHLTLEAAPVTNLLGATSYWNNELYARCFDGLWAGQIDARFLGALDTHAGLDGDKVATTYLGNHDHAHVAWQAGARDNAGALRWYRTQPYVIALLTAPGAPLIQNGQEFAEDYWLMEDDQGTGRRVKPRPLRWDFRGDPIGRPLLGLYAKLIRLRLAHAGLRSDNFYPAPRAGGQASFNPEGYGIDATRGLAIFHRWGTGDDGRLERFIVVLNFTGDTQRVDIPFSVDGVWQDLLNDRADQVTGFRLPAQQIDSYWGRIYFLAE